MSINNYCDEVEEIARDAALRTGALKVCPVHTDVLIRVYDDDAERHAYASATQQLKWQRLYDMRKDVVEAIDIELDMAAEDECPLCNHLKRI